MTLHLHRTTGRALTALQPAWAKAAIVAELHVDVSDSQSDYFNHRTERLVLLAWSRHHRDLFPEMRKAADLFDATAHLGTGKSDFRVAVVLTTDYTTDVTAYRTGQRSPWHRAELDGEDEKVFDTRNAADAWIAQAPSLNDLHGTHGQHAAVAHFAYQITEAPIEHREKWSMGHGYYLKRGHIHANGWSVHKRAIGWFAYRPDAPVEILTCPNDGDTPIQEGGAR
jgi:hypothetical protein